jgi:Domain of unknown function (DUF4331)
MRSVAKTGAIVGAALAAAFVIAFSAARDRAPASLDASSHREAPNISQDPVADNTDFYMWVTPDATDSVTFVVNVVPFQSPYGGPNFYRFGDDVIYRVHIDNDGDAKANIVYEFRFKTEVRNAQTFLYNTGAVTSLDSPNLNVRQFMTVTRVDTATGERMHLAENAPVAPPNIGKASMPDYNALANAAITVLSGGGKVFAGQRDDPFFADLGPIFDLLQIRPMNAIDALAYYNVNSIVLQVPKSALVANDPVIGAWTTTSRTSTAVFGGGPIAEKQVSRLGQPLVNEAVLPLALKDAFNTISPDVDATIPAAVASVTDPEVPKLLKLLFNIDSPPAPRMDLVTIFLTGIPMMNQPMNVSPSEMLRLNTSIAPAASPNRMGVLGGDTAGFPNGRRLIDDVVDIALQALAGATPFTADFNKAPNNTLGDGVNGNETAFLTSFPYLAAPWSATDFTGPRPITARP